jgi:hypothetical protein
VIQTTTATIQTEYLIGRDGLQKVTRQAMVLRSESGAVVARQVFNPWSPCSRLTARDRLTATAQAMGVTVRGQ